MGGSFCDFQQTLPVVTKGMCGDIKYALNPLWSSIQNLNKQNNMRAYISEETQRFLMRTAQIWKGSFPSSNLSFNYVETGLNETIG